MSGSTTSARASVRAVPRLAWSMWTLSMALTVFALLLLTLNLNHSGVHVYDYWLENTLSALLFSTVGAIVSSTLTIAALFNPLRRRIQDFIDRGFYRQKYDAAKTLEDLAAKLRNETDLGALRGGILGVVRDTMQPEHAPLWLRKQEERR
jgi:hypothetical protein